MTAAVLAFTDNFWGDKYNGFEVLNTNMKHGQDSVRELLEFLKESSAIEDALVKSLLKLSKTCGLYGSKGSFGPMWQLIKVLEEKLSSVHFQLTNGWNDLTKDVQRYVEEQQKKQRAVRDSEAATVEIVQNIQQIVVAVQKAKENYYARCIDCERLKKGDVISQKELEKAEGKCRRAADDYRAQIDKYNSIRSLFEVRMTESCKKYQDVEEAHLKQMKEFIKTYACAWRLQRHLLEQVCDEFDASMAEFTIQKLLDKFVEVKMTGREKPGPLVFEEYDASNVIARRTPDPEKAFPLVKPEKPAIENSIASTVTPESVNNSNKQSTSVLTLRGGTTSWFRRRPRRKKTDQQNKDNDDLENGIGDEGKDKRVPTVDSEGFSLPPPPNKGDPGGGGYAVAYSSSEDDSDGEEGRANNAKIKVQIKPFNLLDMPVPTNSTEDLKKFAGALRLSPTTTRRQTPTLEIKMKKSISASDSLSSDPSVIPPVDSQKDESGTLLYAQDYKPIVNWGATSSAVSAAPKAITPWDVVDSSSVESSSQKAAVSTKVDNFQWGNSDSASVSTDQSSWAVFDTPSTTITQPTLPSVLPRSTTEPSTAFQNAFSSDSFPPTLPGPDTSLKRDVISPPLLPVKTRSRSPLVNTVPPISQVSAVTRSFDAWSSSPTVAQKADGWSSFSTESSAPVTQKDDAWNSLNKGPPAPVTQKFDAWNSTPVISSTSVMQRTDSTSFVAAGSSASTPVVTPRSITPSLVRPSTTSSSDIIPIAVAFMETIHAQINATNSLCQMIGDMKISFPADLVRWLSSDSAFLPPLIFYLNNISRCEKILLNNELLTESMDGVPARKKKYAFKMNSLANHLKKCAEQNSRALYYNVDVLRYQVQTRPAGQDIPLKLRSIWKCSANQTDYRLDCHYQPTFVGKNTNALKGIKIIVPVSGGVQQVQSSPSAEWCEESAHAVWRLENIDSGHLIEGLIKAQFMVNEGPSTPGPTMVQFSCDDASLSQIDFELFGSGYKLSLLRNKISTGKYLCW